MKNDHLENQPSEFLKLATESKSLNLLVATVAIIAIFGNLSVLYAINTDSSLGNNSDQNSEEDKSLEGKFPLTILPSLSLSDIPLMVSILMVAIAYGTQEDPANEATAKELIKEKESTTVIELEKPEVTQQPEPFQQPQQPKEKTPKKLTDQEKKQQEEELKKQQKREEKQRKAEGKKIVQDQQVEQLKNIASLIDSSEEFLFDKKSKRYCFSIQSFPTGAEALKNALQETYQQSIYTQVSREHIEIAIQTPWIAPPKEIQALYEKIAEIIALEPEPEPEKPVNDENKTPHTLSHSSSSLYDPRDISRPKEKRKTRPNTSESLSDQGSDEQQTEKRLTRKQKLQQKIAQQKMEKEKKEPKGETKNQQKNTESPKNKGSVSSGGINPNPKEKSPTSSRKKINLTAEKKTACEALQALHTHYLNKTLDISIIAHASLYHLINLSEALNTDSKNITIDAFRNYLVHRCFELIPQQGDNLPESLIELMELFKNYDTIEKQFINATLDLRIANTCFYATEDTDAKNIKFATKKGSFYYYNVTESRAHLKEILIQLSQHRGQLPTPGFDFFKKSATTINPFLMQACRFCCFAITEILPPCRLASEDFEILNQGYGNKRNGVCHLYAEECSDAEIIKSTKAAEEIMKQIHLEKPTNKNANAKAADAELNTAEYTTPLKK